MKGATTSTATESTPNKTPPSNQDSQIPESMNASATAYNMGVKLERARSNVKVSKYDGKTPLDTF